MVTVTVKRNHVNQVSSSYPLGGYGNRISGLGDTKVNASIGRQWKSRVKIIDESIDEISETLSVEELLETKAMITLWIRSLNTNSI